MTDLLSLPIAIPMLTAVLALLVPRRPNLRRLISVAGAGGLVAASIAVAAAVAQEGVVAGTLGGWAPPFGITLVADPLSAILLVVASALAFLVVIYGLVDVDRVREARGYHSLVHLLLAGVCGAFVTGDVFNLYVWFEVMLIATCGLLVLGGSRAELAAGFRYLALNLIATLMLLVAVALLYGLTGTLNMADLHGAVARLPSTGLLSVIAVLFIVAFGVKSALFPLFFWLPATYHVPPVTLTALFAALLTKAGVYALLRLFTLVFTHDPDLTHGLLLAMGAATMVIGVLGAVAQEEIRRILSVHIISQIGYMVVALAWLTPLSLAAAIIYMVHNMVVKTGLVLLAGVIARLTGSGRLDRIGGLYAARPVLSVVFLVLALSLAGLPPLSGFWGKLLVVRAGFAADGFVVAGIALGVGLLTLFSMTKIWLSAFWRPHPGGAECLLPRMGGPVAWLMAGPPVLLAAVTTAMGVFIEPILQAAQAAGAMLADPSPYVRAVMGAGR